MTQHRSEARSAQQAARALGDAHAEIVALGGSTSAVYRLRGPELVVKIRRGDGARNAAMREIDRARLLGQWTPFVVPMDGSAALLNLPDGTVATVWRYVSSGASSGPRDHARLGAAVRSLHRAPVKEAIAAGLPTHRLDDLGDVAVSLEQLAGERRPIRRSLDAVRRSCERLQTALDALRSDPAVVHGDLHPPNILWSAEGPVLCDTDEVGLADPRWDVAFLFDPGRPQRLTGIAAGEFISGYGSSPPDVRTARVFARAAHLRRTAKLLRDPRPHDAWWNLVRAGSWRRMLAVPDRDLVPAVAQSRTDQVRSALVALAPQRPRPAPPVAGS